jgi:benzoylformate decarboxylase
MTTMTGREALIQVLKEEGVEYVFGMPGATEVMFMDALVDHPEIKYILGLNEAASVGMAEGYARVSGKVGFVNLHTFAGVAAATPALFNAQLGGVPMVVTAGKQDNRLLLHEPHLAGDAAGLTSYLTKWSAEITYAEDIPMVMQRAFKIARQPPTGPVFVSLPVNIMEQSVDYDYIPSKPLFTELRPDKDALKKAAELLLNSQKPVIVVENGIARNNAVYETVKFAEIIGARVYQPWQGDVNFPNYHPQYLGEFNTGSPAPREILLSADVVVVIGASLFAEAAYLSKPIVTSNTRIIQIDDNPWEISKNYPADAGILGNIKVSLTELNQLLQKKLTPEIEKTIKSRIQVILKERQAIDKDWAEKDRLEKDRVPTSTTRLMHELKNTLPSGALLIEDAPSCVPALLRILDLNIPGTFFRGRAGGSIGFGIPCAMGVKLAAPQSPVVAVVGDGSSMWSIQALWTSAHYNIPITFVICANGSYRICKNALKRKIGDKIKERCLGMDFDNPRIDFVELAQSMGIPGQKVQTPDGLNKALQSAFKLKTANIVEVYLEDDLKK